MAKNDKILLDGIIDDRVEMKLPSDRRDEVLEYLAFEQILKDYELSKENIEIGWVDGKGDGGIDGFFIFVNGHLLSDVEFFSWPKTGSELEIWIITCKSHDTFKQATLDAIIASITELFELRLEQSELKGDYSEQILKCRENLKLAYRKLSSKMNRFSINFAYASKGDTSEIGESVQARANQLEAIAKTSFGSCVTSFRFYGCTELIEIYRKIPIFSLELPFHQILSSGERYVLLANLKDYYNFISDNGKLRRYLFDSNVRDFMGLNAINSDIKLTLQNDSSPDFWWLNNGVTILATSASVIGKLIQLQDIQIVNGLQTTESIFRYFESGGVDTKNRSVLIKVIVSKEESVRDEITKATNNQTTVESAALRATDKIQRDIEDVLQRNDFFYERRKNFYQNLGHQASHIVSPLYLASGFVNLILKSPQRATTLRQRFMRSDESYNVVFSEKTPIEVWSKIAFILKATDDVLECQRPTKSGANEKFLKKWRQITSFIVISKLLKKFNFNAIELISLNNKSISPEEIELVWNFISSIKSPELYTTGIRSRAFYIEICTEAAKKFEIENVDRVEKTSKFPFDIPPTTAINNASNNAKVDMKFALMVNELLPPQPWKPKINYLITKKLGCTNAQYFKAVDMLISEGIRYRQKDGVVYDSDGNVICFDAERVDPNSLELLP